MSEMEGKPKQLKELVDLFAANISQYKGSGYDEAKIRVDFIDKFFELLGWDVRNLQGYSEQYREVVREDRVEIKGKQKAPDYSFRIGGIRKFFVEAKKPAVDIKNDATASFQLRRYAYTAKLPLSILTDFEEFTVYDTRIKPNIKDASSVSRIFYCTFRECEDNFNFIKEIFSKEAILKGSFDRYVVETKKKKGTSEVDKEILKLIEQWREELAKTIALRNKDISLTELNDSVQRTIDRIIFLRIAEDRGMEDYGRLQTLLDDSSHLYPKLFRMFIQADVKYNSGLFDFRTDKLTPGLKIDDKVLIDIISGLYYPDSPYEFSVLPVEILGNIYEQFLGKTIRLTAGHQAKVEDKPEVKKAGGVYYTPKYIVDYIVKNTVGELVGANGNSPKSPKEIENIKIVDPACGSGSFLLGAYQLLLDHYLNYYTGNAPKGDQAARPHGKTPNPILQKFLKENKIYQIRENEYHLTIQEKQHILLNHIYGVDIDLQAVEVTKLSLMLKLLEGESQESAGYLFKHTDIKLLPNLSSNIKCGNSLIGSDFYESGQKHLFSDNDSMKQMNFFDWEKEFPDVFADGGFAVVIGNPPYVRQEMLDLEFKEYVKNRYKSYAGTADLYVYFFERGLEILKRSGRFGMICSNKWMRANYGKALRRLIPEHSAIEQIVDFGELKVFQDAATFPAIVILSKEKTARQKFIYAPIKRLNFLSLEDEFKTIGEKLDNRSLEGENWTLAGSLEIAIFEKMRKVGIPLGEYVNGKIYRGILTGLNEAFVIDNETRKKLIRDDPKCAKLIKPFICGDDVRKYHINFKNKYLIFSRRGINIKEYSSIENYLLQFKDRLMPKPDNWRGGDWKGRKPGSYEWFEIQDSIDYFEEFEKPKIVYPEIAMESRFSFDNSSYFLNKTCFFIPFDDKYLLGILNSSLIWNYLGSLCSILGDFQRRGRLLQQKIYLEKIPIYAIDFSNKEDKKIHDQMIEMVETILNLQKKYHTARLENEKNLFKKQINILDRQIDQLVYKLYRLSDKEIQIIDY